jgi:hypothetical protein
VTGPSNTTGSSGSFPIIKIIAACVLLLFSLGWIVPAYLGWQFHLQWLAQYQSGSLPENDLTYLDAARKLWNLAGLWFLVILVGWIFYAARKLIPWSD